LITYFQILGSKDLIKNKYNYFLTIFVFYYNSLLITYRFRVINKTMKQTLLGLALLAFTLSACIDQNDYKIGSLETNPDMSISLAYGEVSIGTLLKSQDSTFIKINDEGQVYLEYERELFSQSILTLFDLEDITFGKDFTIPAGFYPATGSDIEFQAFSETINLNLTPQQLNAIFFKEGQLSHVVSMSPSNTGLNFEIQLRLPDFVNQSNNQAIDETLDVGTGSIPLANHLASFEPVNEFDIELKLVLKARSSNVTLIENATISLNLAFEQMGFRSIKGYMGEQSVNDTIQDELTIGAFGNALNGAEVTFANPLLELSITNEYGLPVTIDFLKFAGKKLNDELNIAISPTSPVLIGHPIVMGDDSITIVEITNGSTILSFAPTSIYYKLRPRVNVGNPVDYNNFIIDTSGLTVDLHLVLPLAASAKNIILADTVNFKLEDLQQSNVSEAAIKVSVENEIPLDALLQFYFLDEQGNAVDSLLVENQRRFVPGSEVGLDGKLESPGIFDSMINLDPEKLNLLFTAESLAIIATLTTSPNEDNTYPIVKFLSDYKLKIELGLRANLKVKVDLGK